MLRCATLQSCYKTKAKHLKDEWMPLHVLGPEGGGGGGVGILVPEVPPREGNPKSDMQEDSEQVV